MSNLLYELDGVQFASYARECSPKMGQFGQCRIRLMDINVFCHNAMGKGSPLLVTELSHDSDKTADARFNFVSKGFVKPASYPSRANRRINSEFVCVVKVY